MDRVGRVRTRRHAKVAVAAVLLSALPVSGWAGARAWNARSSGAVPQVVSSAPLSSVAVSPYRILDTRLGIGTGGAVGPLGAGSSIDVQIAGVGPVPANAVGVVLNLTSNEATESGYVTAWPSGEERPTASVLNVTPGIDLPNMVTLALGGGKVSLFNFTGSVHLIADVAAYLIPAATGSNPAGPTHHTLVLTGMGWTRVGGTDGGLTKSGYGCVDPADRTVGMDLPLPGGAIVDKVDVTYHDASTAYAASVSLHFLSFNPGPGYDVVAGSVESSVPGALSTEVATMSLVPTGAPPAVSGSARPFLWAGATYTGGVRPPYTPLDVMICSVEVSYTMPS